METQDTISDYEREQGKPTLSMAHGYIQTNLSVVLAEYRNELHDFF